MAKFRTLHPPPPATSREGGGGTDTGRVLMCQTGASNAVACSATASLSSASTGKADLAVYRIIFVKESALFSK